MPFPCPCTGDCELDARRRNGCSVSWGHPWQGESGGEGFKALRGPYIRRGHYPGAKTTADVEPHEWRCPQYYLGSPFVQSVLVQVDDYDHNRLGPITELPAPLVTYLRVAHAENVEFKTFWESELMPEPKK